MKIEADLPDKWMESYVRLIAIKDAIQQEIETLNNLGIDVGGRTKDDPIDIGITARTALEEWAKALSMVIKSRVLNKHFNESCSSIEQTMRKLGEIP